MSQPDEIERAAALLEGLLVDAALRERFRADPRRVSAEYGVELPPERPRAYGLQTLELRESRSSLAGALMAAAGEGANVIDSMRELHEQGSFTDDAAAAVEKVLTSPQLPAVKPPPVDPSPTTRDSSGIFAALGDSGPRAPGGDSLTVSAAPEPADEAQLEEPEPAPVVATSLADVGDEYPGDDAPREALAAWMARHAHEAGLPGELPVMAALVESGLRNLPGGDRDSIGFFQMRTSIWEPVLGPYGDRPEVQLKWFIDHAVALRDDRVADGDTGFGRDPDSWGDWIADVERPAEEYRYRYQLQLENARGLLAEVELEKSVATLNAPETAEGVELGEGDVQPGAAATTAVAHAKRYLGMPYLWGGEHPSTGFDCSGLTQYVYGQQGVVLPRVAEDQFRVGTPIAIDDLVAGDLVFFKDEKGYIHHMGMALGNGRFLHSPHTGDVVKISKLEGYYAQWFAGGRRVVEAVDGGAAAAAPEVAAQKPSQGTGVFDILQPEGAAAPAASGNTVQFLPAVEDPAAGADE